MQLPRLNAIKTKSIITTAFGGYNNNLVVAENEFKNMKNMTSDYYPVLSPRPQRLIHSKLDAAINGIIVHGNDVYEIMGSSLRKNGELTNLIDLSKGEKEMYVMGAYIIILPDKVLYNTQTGEYQYMNVCVNSEPQQFIDVSFPLAQYYNIFYMSDENGNPYLDCSKYIAQDASGGTSLDEHIKEVGLPACFEKILPFSTYSGAVQKYIDSHKAGTYRPTLLSWNGQSETVMMQQWDEVNDAYWPVDSYCTLILSLKEAELEELASLKAGDYIQLVLRDENGNKIKEEQINDVGKEFFKKMSGNLCIQKIHAEENGIYIVFKGIDFWSWMKKAGLMLTSKNVDSSENVTEVTLSNVKNAVPYPATNGCTIQVAKEMPDMDYITISGNRVWGCSSEKHEIYASALGDPSAWNKFAGIASDSYAVTVGSQGDFTGACTFNNNPYFFKEDLIICLYGSKPSNYQISEIYYPGVEKGSAKSLIEHNSQLYYKGRKGIYRFNGGSSTLISGAFGDEHYKNALAGECRGKLYYSLQDENNEYHLMVYDTEKAMWHREDEHRPLYKPFKINGSLFTVYTNEPKRLYCLREDGDIVEYLETNAIEEEVEWYVETGEMCIESMEKKYISKLMLRIASERKSEFSIALEYDGNGKWETVYTFVSEHKTMARTIPIIPRRCDHMRMRISGKGDVKIFSIQKTITEGSEK